jgi:hypothetical protein
MVVKRLRQQKGAVLWPSFLLTAVFLMVVWLVALIAVKACGIRLFGIELAFSWCHLDQPAAMTQAEKEDLRQQTLLDEITRLEQALLDPDRCPQTIAEPEPEPEPEPEQQAKVCPDNREIRKPVEIRFVIDASRSMRYSLNAPRELELQAMRLWQQIGATTLIDLLNLPMLTQQAEMIERRLEEDFGGPSRMAFTQRAIEQAIDSAPPGPIGTTVFYSCDNVVNYDATENREQLKQFVNRIQPDQGTALAKAIRLGAQALAKRQEDGPVNMVLISDGAESCNMDPCAEAKQAKRQLPGLVINVIDLVGTPALRCVSEATNGFYRVRPENADISSLERTLREAAGYEGDGLCQ